MTDRAGTRMLSAEGDWPRWFAGGVVLASTHLDMITPFGGAYDSSIDPPSTGG